MFPPRDHPKTMYPALQSLRIQPPQPPSQSSIQITSSFLSKNDYRFFKKSQLFLALNQIFTHKQTHQFDDIDQVLSQYIDVQINPLYQTFATLPIQVFACGYCKEIFYTPVQSILHSVDMGCPINHPRSTYFFVFQKNPSLVNNSDIVQILNEHKINSFDEVFCRKEGLDFAKYEFKQKNTHKNPKKQQYNCGRCHRKDFQTINFFEAHCFKWCKSYNLEETSHYVHIFPNQQTQPEFVQDIKNFWVNTNILNLFDDSYIKLKGNFSKNYIEKQDSTKMCKKCEIKFENTHQFLRHSIFECKSTTSQNSLKLMRQKSQNPVMLEKQHRLSYRVVHREQQNIESRKKTSMIRAELNKRYEKIAKDCENMFWCSTCKDIFSDLGLYAAHFQIMFCPVNSYFDSHKLVNKKNELLTNQTLLPLINSSDVDFLIENCSQLALSQKIGTYCNLTHRETGKHYGRYVISKCGKCGINKKMQYNQYLGHIFMTCKQPRNPENSYRVSFMPKIVSPSELSHYMQQAQYSIKICRKVDFQRINVSKNINFNSLLIPNKLFSKAYCGKCQKWMKSIYECYFHYLTECSGMNHPNSSHFFTQNQESFIKNVQRLTRNALKIIGQKVDQKKFTAHLNNVIISRKTNKSRKPNANLHLSNAFGENFTECKSQKQNQESQLQLCVPQQDSFQILENDQNLEFFANIDFNPEKNQNSNYFCGKCQISFKKRQGFIDHIFECKNFKHHHNSHFIMNPTQFNNIHWDLILKRSDLKQNLPKSYPSYFENLKKVICGCGSSSFSSLGHHMAISHSGSIPKGTSHFAIRFRIPSNIKGIITVYLPFEPKLENENDLFVCPCNPHKKLPYRAFANHILKRHDGKTPVFYMKKEEF